MNCIGNCRFRPQFALDDPVTKRSATGIRSTLRLVLERRGYDPKTLDPWYFPSPEEYSKVGFALIQESFLITENFRMIAPGPA